MPLRFQSAVPASGDKFLGSGRLLLRDGKSCRFAGKTRRFCRKIKDRPIPRAASQPRKNDHCWSQIIKILTIFPQALHSGEKLKQMNPLPEDTPL
jgi:hypothetical protein